MTVSSLLALRTVDKISALSDCNPSLSPSSASGLDRASGALTANDSCVGGANLWALKGGVAVGVLSSPASSVMILYRDASAVLFISLELPWYGEACACAVRSGAGGRCRPRSIPLVSDITEESSPRLLAELSLLPARDGLCEGGGVLL